MRLFISYAHVDKFLVRTQVVEILVAGGHEAWFDHHLTGGRRWQDQLYQMITACDAFVYAMTPEAVTSQWCQWEYQQAVQMGKPIMPVLLQKTQLPPELQSLSQLQYIDFTQGASGQAVARLMGGLQYAQRAIDRPADPQGDHPQAVQRIDQLQSELDNAQREIKRLQYERRSPAPKPVASSTRATPVSFSPIPQQRSRKPEPSAVSIPRKPNRTVLISTLLLLTVCGCLTSVIAAFYLPTLQPANQPTATATHDPNRPQITITSPQNGDEATGGTDIWVSGTATDSVGVTRVQLLANDQLMKTVLSLSASGDQRMNILLDYRPTTTGDVKLEVIAYRGAIASDPATIHITVRANESQATATMIPQTSVPVIDLNDRTCRALINVGLNVRSGPGSNYNRITTLQPGTQAPIIGRLGDNSWWQVRLNTGQSGWVIQRNPANLNEEFVTILGICTSVPIVSQSPSPTIFIPPPIVIPPTQFIPPTVFIPPTTPLPTLTTIPMFSEPTSTTFPIFPTDTPIF